MLHVTTFDKVLVGVELAIPVAVGLAFLIPYLARGTWRRSPWGWHMVAVTVAMAGEAASLLLLLLGWPPPIWVYELGFGLVDLVVVHRLVLYWRTVHEPADGDDPPTP